MAARKRKGGGGGGFATVISWFLAIAFVVAFFQIPAHQSVTGTLAFFEGKTETIKVWAEGLGDEFTFGDLFNGNAAGKGTDKTENASGDKKNRDDSNSHPGSETSTDVDTSMMTLKTFTISEPNKVNYDRDEWKHWVTAPGGAGSCWNTRDEVLYRQSTPDALVLLDKNKETTTDKSNACSIQKGEWIGPFTGKTFTDPGDLDIDHVAPLAYVARHGGQEWDADKKEAYANDLTKTNLLAVDASANRSKGDRGPAEWQPEEEFQCDYAIFWIDSIDTWKFSISKADSDALEDMLETC